MSVETGGGGAAEKEKKTLSKVRRGEDGFRSAGVEFSVGGSRKVLAASH